MTTCVSMQLARRVNAATSMRGESSRAKNTATDGDDRVSHALSEDRRVPRLDTGGAPTARAPATSSAVALSPLSSKSAAPANPMKKPKAVTKRPEVPVPDELGRSRFPRRLTLRPALRDLCIRTLANRVRAHASRISGF